MLPYSSGAKPVVRMEILLQGRGAKTRTDRQRTSRLWCHGCESPSLPSSAPPVQSLRPEKRRDSRGGQEPGKTANCRSHSAGLFDEEGRSDGGHHPRNWIFEYRSHGFKIRSGLFSILRARALKLPKGTFPATSARAGNSDSAIHARSLEGSDRFTRACAIRH